MGDAEVQKAKVALEGLILWIDENTSGATLPGDERALIVCGCIDSAIEHQAAIVLLHNSKLYAPMFALLRVLAEAVIRGLWLQHCATDNELNKFKTKGIERHLGGLIQDIESTIDSPNGALSKLKLSGWSALCDFTHTGIGQVSRRHHPGRIEANYLPDDIVQALNLAGALGLISAGQLIAMSDRQDSISSFYDKMSEYAGS